MKTASARIKEIKEACSGEQRHPSEMDRYE